MLAGQSPYPERARWLHLAHLGSQSQREIQFILPAHRARHIIKGQNGLSACLGIESASNKETIFDYNWY